MNETARTTYAQLSARPRTLLRVDLRVALALLAPDYLEPSDEITRLRLTWRIGDTLAAPTLEHLRALWIILGYARGANHRAELERQVRGWQGALTDRERRSRLRELAHWCRLRERQIMAAVVRGLALTPAAASKPLGTHHGPLRARRAVIEHPQGAGSDKKSA